VITHWQEQGKPEICVTGSTKPMEKQRRGERKGPRKKEKKEKNMIRPRGGAKKEGAPRDYQKKKDGRLVTENFNESQEHRKKRKYRGKVCGGKSGKQNTPEK